MMDYRFVYILATLAAITLWILMYLLRPRFRKEMFFMSVLVSVLGITELLFIGEYWNPVFSFPVIGDLGVEPFLLAGFLYGGLGSVLYRAVTNERYWCPPSIPLSDNVLHYLSALGVGAFLFIASDYALEINIIYSACFALLGAGLMLAYFSPGSLRTMLFNGALFGIFAVACISLIDLVFPGYITATWNTAALSGVHILNVPLEEFLFHFSVGFAFAIAYETLYHCRVLKRPRR